VGIAHHSNFHMYIMIHGSDGFESAPLRATGLGAIVVGGAHPDCTDEQRHFG
jgi:hypothetical protein